MTSTEIYDVNSAFLYVFIILLPPEVCDVIDVWVQVVGDSSWRVLERLVALPTRQEVHPSGTVMRILVKPVVFKVKIEQIFDPPNAEVAS